MENPVRGTVLGSTVMVAESSLARLRGMLGRPAPGAGEGMLLAPCRGVHTYGMRYPLDVVFLDQEGMVVAIYPALPPGTRTPLIRGASFALELPPGTVEASGTLLGDALSWTPSSDGVPAR